MKKDDKNIDDLFKEGLGDYAETPPPAVWDALERRITGPTSPRFVYRGLGYVALLLLGVSLSVSVAKMFTHNTTQATNDLAVVETPVATRQDAAPAPGSNSVAGVATREDQTGAANKTGEETTREPNQTTGNQVPITTKTTAATGAHKATAKTTGNGNKSRKNSTNDAESDNIVYNATPTNETVKQAPAENTHQKEVAQAKPETQKKNETPKPQVPVNNEIRHKITPHFDRWEAGLKGGMERSFDDAGAIKYLLSPYIAFNLSPRFAIMTQPSIKYATVSGYKIGNDKSYYKANGDSSSKLIIGDDGRPFEPVNPVGGGTALYITYYNYTQSHDSIIKSYFNQQSYTEFDLPLLVKYKVSKTFAVYGGVNLSYSNYSGIKENTYVAKNIAITKPGATISPDSAVGAPHPIASEITYPDTGSIASYKPSYTGQRGFLRVGYMVGFSYEFSNRWLFDALVEQTPTPANMQGGYNLNFPLSTAYFRFTLGYKLIK
jgi:hypothetical protein